MKKMLATMLAMLCLMTLGLSMGLAEEAEGSGLPIVADLELGFGHGGPTYTLHMYDNDTAVGLVRALGSNSLNLPIYNYEGFEGSEYMQYYDVNVRDLPDSPEPITSVKAGEVYFSYPNRVILIYRDAEITGEYTRVGYVETDDQFSDVVADNPVLEGWGNKIITVRRVTE